MRMRTSFDKKHGFYNELFLAGDGFSDYNGILARPEYEAEAVPAFAEYVKRKLNWARFTLENLTMSDRRRRLFLRAFDKIRFTQTAISYQYPTDPTNHAICPSIRLPGSWDQYLKSLSGNNRQKIRRFLKKIDSSKDCRITLSDIESYEKNLATLLEFWKIKWTPSKGERAGDIAQRNWVMLTRCAENGTLFLPVFWHGDKPVAGLATLIDPCKKALLFFVTGRDETYNEMPAGFLLHAYSIRHAIAHGFTTYDFLKGNEPYKYLFAPQVERRQRPVSVGTKTGRNLGGKLDPRGLPTMLDMALEFEKKEQIADAELGYRQILEIDPDHALGLYRFGRLMSENGNHGEAKKLLSRSVEVEPEGDNAWFWLGRSLQSLGESEAALAAYREVVKLQPQNKEAKTLILQLSETVKPAAEPVAANVWPVKSPAGAPAPRQSAAETAAADPGLVLQKKVQELRNLTQDYFDAFVNPRPRW
jgi:Acetyltransferase (GNAT) domain/Tetratricopeptide repeat